MRLSAWPLLALTLAAFGGWGPGAPSQELELRVRAGVEEVELGVGFPLTVVRIWSVDLVPEDFRDEALAPLVVRLLDTNRREEDQRIEETLHYRAYAFSLGEFTVPAPLFRARRIDGSEVVASGEALTLPVRSALGAEPDQAELPGDPFPAGWIDHVATLLLFNKDSSVLHRPVELASESCLSGSAILKGRTSQQPKSGHI